MVIRVCLRLILSGKNAVQVFLQNSGFGLPVRNVSSGLYCVAIKSNK